MIMEDIEEIKGQGIQDLTQGLSDVFAVCFCHGSLVSGGHDKIVYVWEKDIKNSRVGLGVSMRLKGHTHSVKALAAHEVVNDESKSRIISGSWDTTAIIWSWQTGVKLYILQGHENRIRSVCVSSYPFPAILTGGDDKSILVWDVYTGVALARSSGHHGGSIATLANVGNMIASGGADRNVMVWDYANAAKGVEARKITLKGHTDRVTALAAMSKKEQESRLVSASKDGKLIVWDVKRALVIRTIAFANADADGVISTYPTCLSFLVAHNEPMKSILMLTGDDEGKLLCWDVENGSAVKEERWPDRDVDKAIYSISVCNKNIDGLDGHGIAVAGSRGTLRLYTVDKNEHVMEVDDVDMRRAAEHSQRPKTPSPGKNKAPKILPVMGSEINSPPMPTTAPSIPRDMRLRPPIHAIPKSWQINNDDSGNWFENGGKIGDLSGESIIELGSPEKLANIKVDLKGNGGVRTGKGKGKGASLNLSFPKRNPLLLLPMDDEASVTSKTGNFQLHVIHGSPNSSFTPFQLDNKGEKKRPVEMGVRDSRIIQIRRDMAQTKLKQLNARQGVGAHINLLPVAAGFRASGGMFQVSQNQRIPQPGHRTFYSKPKANNTLSLQGRRR